MDEHHITIPHLPDLERLSRSNRNDVDPTTKPLFEGWVKDLEEPRVIGTGGAGDFESFFREPRSQTEAEVKAKDEEEKY
jgi:hypothetical protein